MIADSILVVRLDPAGSRRVLTIPRDLRVVDERTGAQARIGSLVDDRAVFARAVAHVAGVAIDHYIESDTDGFAAIADAAGGVRMQFGRAVRDGHSGFGTDGGCEMFDGARLRAYVRSRYTESWDGAEWTLDPTSDVGRMLRLRDLAQRVVADIVDGGGLDLDDLLFRVLPHLTVDDGLTLAEARRYASLARALRERPLDMETAPVHQIRVGDADMWEMIDAEAPRSFLVDGPGPVAAGGPARADFLAVRPWPGTCA